MIIPILQFLHAKGAGEAALRRFLWFASANGEEEAFAACSHERSLELATGIKTEIAHNIIEAAPTAQELANELTCRDISVLWLGSRHFPERLVRILGDDTPPVLFVRGNTNILHQTGVGFCGSRKASDKGLGVTSSCAKQLAESNICVVSGYAHGVDMAAHKSALENKGTTIFVLVDGILRFTPKREIADFITDDNHLIVSQFSPHLPWIGRNAMKRNSTIIGLSDAMILVESGLSGGTFAAGEDTLRRKRPLFVIDFAEPGPSAEANPYFISKGGIPVRGNSLRIPTLEKVKEIASRQTWHQNNLDAPNIFTYK